MFELKREFLEKLHNKLEHECRNRQGAKNYCKKNKIDSNQIVEPYALETIPTKQYLVTLIETSFWASIKKEEGRSLSFIIGYYSPIAEKPIPNILLLEPKDFTVKELVKLVPSVEANLGIAIALDNNEQLKIIGLFLDESYIEGIAIKIKLLEPGQLVVALGNENIARIGGEEKETALIQHPFAHLNITLWYGFSYGNYPWADANIVIIIRCLTKMRELGHGGTLIVVSSEDDKYLSSLDIQYKVTKQIEVFGKIKQEIQTYLIEGLTHRELDAREIYPIKYQPQIESLGNTLAQYTCVDGATIINRKLDILGFGAKISIQKEENFVISTFNSITGASSIMKLSEIGGMRHQSAARFLNENRDALVFVVSQDKTITALCYRSEQVQAYRYLEFSLF